jgi:sigma-B regulation protein RsbU (phosphoserine phosphatase)
MSTPLQVLVVDDDEEDFLIARDLLADIPGEQRYEAYWARTPEAALAQMLPSNGREARHAICLLDYRLGSASGVSLLEQARAKGYTRPVLLLTGSDNPLVDQEALAVGASDYLVKGRATPELMERSIRYAIAQKAIEAKLRATAEALEEAHHQEFEVGAVIQRALLLRQRPASHPDGLSVGVYLQGADHVSGDYCDFLTFREQSLDVVLGDVMGRGIKAALVSAGVKSQLQLVARRLVTEFHCIGRLPEPQEIVGSLQAVLSPILSDLDSFVTLNYVRFMRDQHRLYFVDAGHPSILHWQASTQESMFLKGSNVPLGAVANEFYEQHLATFGLGDIFVLYSDGLTTALNAEGEPFGEERLKESLNPHLEPQELANALCQTVNAWRGGIGDDLTCVVVRIEKMRPRLPIPLLQKDIEFRSHPEELERLRHVTEELCRACGAQKYLDNILLGLSEAAGNVIKHAYVRRTEEWFRLKVRVYDDKMLFILHDRGRKFDINAIQPPLLDGSMNGGFGWHLINSCFDEVTYRRDEMGWNHLQLKIIRDETETNYHGTN